MPKKNTNPSIRLIKRLRNMPFWTKIISLFVYSYYLFPFFITEDILRIYLVLLFVLVISVASLYRIAVGKKEFRSVILFWLIGTFIYLIFTIPLIYTQFDISPHLKLDNIIDRWLYTIALPIRLLGLFSGGLIFIRIISPIEFLRWKNFGYIIALLFRVIEQAKQKIHETRIALLMQNNWPEESGNLNRFRVASLIIKSSPKLIITTIRNMIVWFPWAWLCFKRFKGNFKGGRR